MSPRARIRETVKAFIRRGDTISPAAIADAVIGKLEGEDREMALAIAMPYLVRDELRKYRFTGIGQPPPRGRGGAWEQHIEDRAKHSPQTTSDAAADRSAKSQAYNAVKNGNPVHDSAMLDTPFHVNGEWKPLGSFTAADCRAMHEDLRDTADKYETRAEGWEKLAAALEDAGAATVRDYSAGADVREAFGAVVG